MEQLPVDKCIDVLDVFCAYPNEDLWVNRIVEIVRNATGSHDSPKIKKAINYLKQARILEGRKIGTQKQKQILTPLGIEIISFMVNIGDVNETLAKFYSTLNKLQKLRRKTKQMINYTLAKKGWTKPDINSFYHIYETFTDIFELFENNICNLILSRFISLIKTTISNNILNKILTTLIVEEITNLSSFFATYDIAYVVRDEGRIVSDERATNVIIPISKETDDNLGPNLNPKRIENENDLQQKHFHITLEPFFKQVDETFAFNLFPENGSIISEGNDLVKSMIAVAGFDTNQLKWKELITNFMGFGTQETFQGRKFYPDNCSKLTKLYSELIGKTEHPKNF